MRQPLLTLALAPLSLAADATLTMFYPLNSEPTELPSDLPTATLDPSDFSDIETPLVSIVTANPSTTIAALGCGPETSSTDCLFNGFTYTAIAPTVYKYHYVAEYAPNVPFTVDIACTGKSPAVTCTTSMPGADKISVSGVDPSELSAAIMTGTSTYSGNQVSFLAAPVTAGQELLSGGAAPTGSAAPKGSQSGGAAAPSGSSGAQGTASGAQATQSGEKPAEQTGKNAAGRVGGKVGVVVGALGVAAAGLL